MTIARFKLNKNAELSRTKSKQEETTSETHTMVEMAG